MTTTKAVRVSLLPGADPGEAFAVAARFGHWWPSIDAGTPPGTRR
ncbi:hypothetical protein ACFRFU_03975 [Streptomyces sp. NPDC056704]